MKVLILAAGYGTRLYPHTRNFPKALLRVNKKPLIDHLIAKLEGIRGISKIIVVTNGRFFAAFRKWRAGLSCKGKIFIVNDLTKAPQERLGAIGDMQLVFKQEAYDDDFLVLGGDNFFDGPLDKFVAFARAKAPAVTIGIFDIETKAAARDYGVVTLDHKERVKGFSEKPRRPASSLIAMCLYYFPKVSVALIKKYLTHPKHSHDAAGAYIKWLVQETTVYTYLFKNFWFDIGHLQTYNKIKELTKGA